MHLPNSTVRYVLYILIPAPSISVHVPYMDTFDLYIFSYSHIHSRRYIFQNIVKNNSSFLHNRFNSQSCEVSLHLCEEENDTFYNTLSQPR